MELKRYRNVEQALDQWYTDLNQSRYGRSEKQKEIGRVFKWSLNGKVSLEKNDALFYQLEENPTLPKGFFSRVMPRRIKQINKHTEGGHRKEIKKYIQFIRKAKKLKEKHWNENTFMRIFDKYLGVEALLQLETAYYEVQSARVVAQFKGKKHTLFETMRELQRREIYTALAKERYALLFPEDN